MGPSVPVNLAQKLLLHYTLQGEGKLSKLGVEGVVATSAVLTIFVFAPKTKTNIAAMYLKLPVYGMIVIFFLNKPKTLSKSLILRILVKKLEIRPIFIQNPQIQFFTNPDVIKTSL